MQKALLPLPLLLDLPRLLWSHGGGSPTPTTPAWQTRAGHAHRTLSAEACALGAWRPAGELELEQVGFVWMEEEGGPKQMAKKGCGEGQGRPWACTPGLRHQFCHLPCDLSRLPKLPEPQHPRLKVSIIPGPAVAGVWGAPIAGCP